MLWFSAAFVLLFPVAAAFAAAAAAGVASDDSFSCWFVPLSAARQQRSTRWRSSRVGGL